MSILQNVKQILSELPDGVKLVAAAKSADIAVIMEAIKAGVEIIGENYLQEAEEAYKIIGKRVKWHYIGHLQRNKVKKAVTIFDMIETVDSIVLAREIDNKCALISKVMPVLVEVNSCCEEQKTGIPPDCTEDFIKEISNLDNIKVMGLMTMGPVAGKPEEARPYFALTKKVFDDINRLNISSVEMKYLSMGMTNSYKIAIEEGANIIRIGSKIFGQRKK
ncbi:MAG: YggS family pyridoxal phosphate-dependent enzyme [Dehalococcoidales bacterium]|nr:YggS family pyridoxal phosphate-dependent enzyme [Dehalococcoidales bacterium]